MDQLVLQHTETEPDAYAMLPVSNFTADSGATGEFLFGAMNLSHVLWLEPAHVPTGPLPFRAPGGATVDSFSPDEYTSIENLGEGAYRVRQPLPVKITRIGAGNFEASFREANIAISGTDSDDAFQALVAEILDTLDTLVAEPKLIPRAARQLQILREYIAQDEA